MANYNCIYYVFSEYIKLLYLSVVFYKLEASIPKLTKWNLINNCVLILYKSNTKYKQ